MSTTPTSGWPIGTTPSPAMCGEDARVTVIGSYGVDEIVDDAELAAITRFAAQLAGCPIALVSLVERERQRFLAREGLDVGETPRSLSFCAHAMLGSEPMEVPDATLDARFADNELVTGELGIRFYAGSPLVSSDGAPLGALCVIDTVPRPGGLTDLQRNGLQVLAQAVMRRLEGRREGLEAQAALQTGEERLQVMAELMPVVAWSADESGQIEFLNNAAREYFGDDIVKPGVRMIDFLHPDDVERVRPLRDAAMKDGTAFEAEARLHSRDGSHRWMLVRALPVRGSGSSPFRWFGAATDIDDGHRLSESRDILAKELSHRIKNIFAVVAGLVSIRARRHAAAREFADELVHSIRALGRAHDFVRPMEGAKGDSLRGLLGELMAPYSSGDNRVTIAGEDCTIGPRAATPLALIFHELATNSAKYGALSVEGGRIEITVDCPEGDDRASITWREAGGPALTEPQGEGFGSRLVQMSIEGQLGGRMERRFSPGGLEVDLSIPLASIRS